MRSNLQTRIITAALLASVLLGVVLLLPAIASVAVLAALVVMGAWEWSAFLRTSNVAVRAAYVALIAILLYTAWHYTGSLERLRAALTVTVVWWILAFIWVVLAPRRVAPWSAALAGIFALVPAWLALAHLRLDWSRGAEWLLFVFLLVWTADIGGYVFGRRYGRLRLAPSVSPGKTWEGAVGGIVLSALVALGGSAWFGVSPGRFVLLCLAVVVFSIVGDLTESLLKRFTGVKDSGTLFPGHGGVMDRIDSVTAAAPVMLLGLLMLGVIH